MDLTAIRAELPVLARSAYLNAGTFGPLPRRTVETMTALSRRDLEEGRAGKQYFEGMLDGRERLRAEFAAVLGAGPESVALTTATTHGCAVVVAGLGLGAQDEVVTTDSEHPGLLGALVASGAAIRKAAVGDRPAAEAPAAILAEVGPRTRLVAVSHVLWTTGAVLPVEELSGRGVPVLVDGAQGAGALPVDVEALGCDFYAVSGQKWLLGPDATGALYVRPGRVEELRMAVPTYFSWKPRTYEPQDGAARFDAGWIPPATLEGMLASLAFAREVGPERFEQARAQAERCRALLAERFSVVTEPDQGTLVAFRPGGDAAETVARLAEQRVVVRDLPETGCLRASIGFWTNDEDVDRLVAAL